MTKTTCGNCGRSWDDDADPGPASLCHYCHGRGHSTDPVDGLSALDTVQRRGFSLSGYFDAMDDDNEEAMTLTHPSNWMSEEEVETGLLGTVMRQISRARRNRA